MVECCTQTEYLPRRIMSLSKLLRSPPFGRVLHKYSENSGYEIIMKRLGIWKSTFEQDAQQQHTTTRHDNNTRQWYTEICNVPFGLQLKSESVKSELHYYSLTFAKQWLHLRCGNCVAEFLQRSSTSLCQWPWPFRFTIGPPLFPTWIAASVWIYISCHPIVYPSCCHRILEIQRWTQGDNKLSMTDLIKRNDGTLKMTSSVVVDFKNVVVWNETSRAWTASSPWYGWIRTVRVWNVLLALNSSRGQYDMGVGDNFTRPGWSVPVIFLFANIKARSRT